MSNETENDVSIVEDIQDKEHNEKPIIAEKQIQNINNTFNVSLNNITNCNPSQTISNSTETDEEMDTTLSGDNNCNNGLVMTNGDINDDNNGNNGSEDQDSIECDDNQDKDIDNQNVSIICEKIKYDITESEDTITVYVYVKKCDDIDIDFREDSIEVRFKTCDVSFNDIHRQQDPLLSKTGAHFIWKINLRDKIIPEECSHKLSPAKFEIRLKKKCTRFKWNTLEQTTTQIIPTPQQLTNNISNINNQPFIGPQQQFAFNNTNVDNSGDWLPIVSNEENNKRKLEWSNVTTSSNKTIFSNESINPVGKELVSINNNIFNDTNNRRLGYTGLDNLGNTCFMNAVIQCLSNTDPFRDYFSSDHYKQDINETNPLGTGGQIAMAFANLLKQLWLGKQSSVPPQRLKSLISEKVSQQFSGFAQHDAQELMAFLLDALHEDLNRIKQKPYIAVNNDDCDNGNIGDEQMADDAWKRYRMRNDSVVVDLFQGQFKSKLVCPVCGKISITFDPFLYLSVPFPKPPVVYEVYFFKRDSNGMSTSKPIKYKIRLAHDSTVQKLLDFVSKETNVPTSALRLIKASNNGSMPTFHSNPKWTLTKPQTGDSLLLFELLAPNENIKQDIHEFTVIQRLSQPTKSDNCAKCDKNSGWDNVDLKACAKCHRVAYCNKTCQTEDWSDHKKDCIYRPEPIGLPFIISVDKSQLTYRNLCAIVYSYARHSIRIPQNSDTLVLNLNNFPIPPPFVLRAYRDLKADEIEEVISPQLEPQEDGDIDNCYDQPLDIKNYYIALDWINSKNYGNNWVEVESLGIDCDTDYKSTIIAERSEAVLLEDCLRLFTEPEVLNPQEAWFCPQCKENREATKQIALWRLPHILVIQLKRFSFRNIIWRDKIDRIVRYPINGLDISEFYCRTEYDPDFRPIYDLYGVVNHFGGMFGGHYTAFAKSSNNLENLGWRSFDDSRVEDMAEDSVVTRNAYMLFYKLRE